MTFRALTRALYHWLVPAGVRSSAGVAAIKKRLLPHDGIYGDAYYAETEEASARSAGPIADSIIAAFAPASVVDVGCGAGHLLDAFRHRNCRVFGFDYSDAALRRCRARGLEVEKKDLENAQPSAKRFDVATSLEVAEHLSTRATERYVRLLASLADVVVLTAAPPGQGGVGHVNEQSREFWIERFRKAGYEVDEPTAARWSADWKASGVADWYYDNLLLFRRAGAATNS